jgi:hypothetical protein
LHDKISENAAEVSFGKMLKRKRENTMAGTRDFSRLASMCYGLSPPHMRETTSTEIAARVLPGSWLESAERDSVRVAVVLDEHDAKAVVAYRVTARLAAGGAARRFADAEIVVAATRARNPNTFSNVGGAFARDGGDAAAAAAATCPICAEPYDDDSREPRMVAECRHTFCAECADRLPRHCPVCRRDSGDEPLATEPNTQLADWLAGGAGRRCPACASGYSARGDRCPVVFACGHGVCDACSRALVNAHCAVCGALAPPRAAVRNSALADLLV